MKCNVNVSCNVIGGLHISCWYCNNRVVVWQSSFKNFRMQRRTKFPNCKLCTLWLHNCIIKTALKSVNRRKSYFNHFPPLSHISKVIEAIQAQRIQLHCGCIKNWVASVGIGQTIKLQFKRHKMARTRIIYQRPNTSSGGNKTKATIIKQQQKQGHSTRVNIERANNA